MRWFGFVDDPVAGGSTLEDLLAAGGGAAVAWEDADTFVPVSAAQVDPGLTDQDRNNEVRGILANSAPRSFASAPSETFTVRAYPAITVPLVRKALSGAIASSGAGTAARVSTISPALAADDLLAMQTYLVREGQLDRISGAVVSELAFNFPVDEEGSIDVTLAGLYHDVDPTDTVAGLPDPAYSAADYGGETYRLMKASAFLGAGAGTEIDCLAGFGLTWNTGLVEEMRSRFCANHNIEATTIDGDRHELWYPDRHKRSRRTVTGRLDFGDVRPDRELRLLLRHAEKLVFEVSAGPITPATVPPADEMMQFTVYKHAPTGGGADPLAPDGDQVSSYEFGGFLDEVTGKDFEAAFTRHDVVA